ncbi:MAG: 1-(5-phosphoribosyl)-5-[(5-phosphoribosylamino)methylideneamino] imidazole-4-carboxamide isomerase [Candidatus Micrarchaeia archaeon]
MVEVIPAIDILGGRPARLSRGTEASAKYYAREPAQVARELYETGFERLHVVDLDAAFGKSPNTETIRRICGSCGIKVQVGGGIRSIERAGEIIGLGADRIIIGTAALDKGFLGKIAGEFGDKAWVACDVSAGMVATRGWVEKSGMGMEQFIGYANGFGIGGIIVSDIKRDGMLEGIDTGFFKKAVEISKKPVIASGGVAGIEDIKKAGECGVSGLIIGKAMYEGKIDMREALEASKKE